MKKSISIKALMVTALCLGTSGAVSAQWTQSLELSQAQTVFVTSKGTVLASDQDYDGKGGIYYSDDEGETWTKTAVADWQYNEYVEAGDYIFATGEGCRVARSEDDGRSWLVLNYSRTIADYVSEKEIDYVTAYGLAYDPELHRVYVAVYAGDVGIIYTDDFGVTWQFTDRQSLMQISDGSGVHMDTFYHLTMYDGRLVCFGLYLAYEYDAQANRWQILTTPNGQAWSCNCMGVTTIKDNVLYAGRAMENTDGFVYKTTDLSTWTALPAPADVKSGYVRALASDANNIYAATLKTGIYYSPDNGMTWQLTGDGFEKSSTYEFENIDFTTSLAESENYIYCAQFNPLPTMKSSGVWRMRKSELGKFDSVTEVAANAPTVRVEADMIVVTGAADAEVTVVGMGGTTVLSGTGSLSTSALCPGVYVYKVTTADASVTGKFVK